MTDQRPPARRRRLVPDARLLLGIGLVVASVIGVVTVVNAADIRSTVYVAARTLAPGDRLVSDDLLARRVALDDATGLYLSSGEIPDGGLVATAVVRQGELVPRSSVGSAAGSESTSLVLQLTGEVSESVVAGALVDVWSSSNDSNSIETDDQTDPFGAFSAPVVLCADAVVIRVLESDGIVSGTDGRAVEVLVPRIRIARLLQAIADDDALAVVPAGIPLASP
jgi:hypothetical protein